MEIDLKKTNQEPVSVDIAPTGTLVINSAGEGSPAQEPASQSVPVDPRPTQPDPAGQDSQRTSEAPPMDPAIGQLAQPEGSSSPPPATEPQTEQSDAKGPASLQQAPVAPPPAGGDLQALETPPAPLPATEAPQSPLPPAALPVEAPQAPLLSTGTPPPLPVEAPQAPLPTEPNSSQPHKTENKGTEKPSPDPPKAEKAQEPEVNTPTNIPTPAEDPKTAELTKTDNVSPKEGVNVVGESLKGLPSADTQSIESQTVKVVSKEETSQGRTAPSAENVQVPSTAIPAEPSIEPPKVEASPTQETQSPLITTNKEITEEHSTKPQVSIDIILEPKSTVTPIDGGASQTEQVKIEDTTNELQTPIAEKSQPVAVSNQTTVVEGSQPEQVRNETQSVQSNGPAIEPLSPAATPIGSTQNLLVETNHSSPAEISPKTVDIAKIEGSVETPNTGNLPLEQSSQPTQIPSQPTQVPSEPTQIPSEPTQAPSEPTQIPSEPTQAPSEPTQIPSELTQAPSPSQVSVSSLKEPQHEPSQIETPSASTANEQPQASKNDDPKPEDLKSSQLELQKGEPTIEQSQPIPSESTLTNEQLEPSLNDVKPSQTEPPTAVQTNEQSSKTDTPVELLSQNDTKMEAQRNEPTQTIQVPTNQLPLKNEETTPSQIPAKSTPELPNKELVPKIEESTPSEIPVQSTPEVPTNELHPKNEESPTSETVKSTPEVPNKEIPPKIEEPAPSESPVQPTPEVPANELPPKNEESTPSQIPVQSKPGVTTNELPPKNEELPPSETVKSTPEVNELPLKNEESPPSQIPVQATPEVPSNELPPKNEGPSQIESPTPLSSEQQQSQNETPKKELPPQTETSPTPEPLPQTEISPIPEQPPSQTDFIMKPNEPSQSEAPKESSTNEQPSQTEVPAVLPNNEQPSQKEPTIETPATELPPQTEPTTEKPPQTEISIASPTNEQPSQREASVEPPTTELPSQTEPPMTLPTNELPSQKEPPTEMPSQAELQKAPIEPTTELPPQTDLPITSPTNEQPSQNTTELPSQTEPVTAPTTNELPSQNSTELPSQTEPPVTSPTTNEQSPQKEETVQSPAVDESLKNEESAAKTEVPSTNNVTEPITSPNIETLQQSTLTEPSQTDLTTKQNIVQQTESISEPTLPTVQPAQELKEDTTKIQMDELDSCLTKANEVLNKIQDEFKAVYDQYKKLDCSESKSEQFVIDLTENMGILESIYAEMTKIPSTIEQNVKQTKESSTPELENSLKVVKELLETLENKSNDFENASKEANQQIEETKQKLISIEISKMKDVLEEANDALQAAEEYRNNSLVTAEKIKTPDNIATAIAQVKESQTACTDIMTSISKIEAWLAEANKMEQEKNIRGVVHLNETVSQEMDTISDAASNTESIFKSVKKIYKEDQIQLLKEAEIEKAKVLELATKGVQDVKTELTQKMANSDKIQKSVAEMNQMVNQIVSSASQALECANKAAKAAEAAIKAAVEARAKADTAQSNAQKLVELVSKLQEEADKAKLEVNETKGLIEKKQKSEEEAKQEVERVRKSISALMEDKTEEIPAKEPEETVEVVSVDAKRVAFSSQLQTSLLQAYPVHSGQKSVPNSPKVPTAKQHDLSTAPRLTSRAPSKENPDEVPATPSQKLLVHPGLDRLKNRPKKVHRSTTTISSRTTHEHSEKAAGPAKTMNPVLQGFAQYSEAGASTGQLFDPDAILKKTKEQQEKDKERSEAVAKLIQIRGTSRVHARQVLLAAGSLNDANVFVLDDLKCLYIWHGKKCSRMEKATGLDVASRINRQYHGGRMDIAKLESGQEDESFWTAIGGKTEIAPMSVGLVTKDTNKEYAAMDCLYVYDEEGDDLITIEGKRDQKQLNEARSYILDCTDEFYVWHGKKVSNEIKQKANTKAKELFDSKPRQPWTQIERANQGGEPVLFVMKFALWEPDATLSGYVPVRGNVAKHIKQEDVQKMDVKKMYNAAPIVGWSFAMEDRDDGRNGSFIIWSIDSFSKKPIPEEEYGHFYSKKSYIILYSWCHDEKYVIYFWQGEHSSINEKGTSATLTTDVNEKYCYNRAILTRVVQYREPKHMLMCFDHNFVVHRGESRDLKKDTRMYQVRGTDRTNTRVTEIIKTSSSLYTGDVFFVTSPEAIYLWKGKHSNPFSLQYAIAIINKINLEKSNVVTVETQQPSKSPVVNRKDKSPKVPRKDEKTGETTVSIEEIQLARKKMVEKAPEYQYVIENGLLPVIVIEEGQEPEEFWKAIGGKKEYIQKPFKVDPKLFFCESDLGVFNCHRIFDFVQADLLPRKMLILDLYEVVYLWIGKEHNHMGDRKLALELVLEYVAKAPDGRPPNDPKVVKEGFEPLDFGAAFQAFRFSGKNAPLVLVTEALSEFSETYIPYEKLKNKKTLPSTVDTSRLEDYLSNEEFEAVFTMKREEWKDKPLWKRQEEKKKAGLY